MLIENSFEQLSPEWFAARAGIPSASNFDKIITGAGQPSKQAEKYMYQLAGERLLGTKEESYCNAAMQRGIELEPEARSFYEALYGCDVEQAGLVYKDERKIFSCSPDGLLENGGLEIKCPQLSTHIEYLTGNKIPSTYYQQVQGSLYICGLEFWDFMSYYPGIKPFIIRVEPDLKFHARLEVELEKFCFQLDVLEKKIRDMK